MLGTIIGIAGVAVSLYIAWAARQLELPFQRARPFLETGRYKLFAPSREIKDRAVTWHIEISKALLTPPRVRAWCVWRSDVDQPERMSRVWMYKGRMVQVGDQVLFELTSLRHRSKIVEIDGEKLEATTSTNDRTDWLFHVSTIDLPLKPGIATGFDARSNCYGALCVLAEETLEIEREAALALATGCSFLEYNSLLKAIETASFVGNTSQRAVQKSCRLCENPDDHSGGATR